MPILRPEERIGSVINERYRIDRILGKGGMGVVFAGTHTWTNRPIAVKLLLPQYAEDSAILQRFFQEARAAAALQHPHVIDVIDMGEDDEGMAFIVLEYLDGEPLTALLKREGAIDLATLLEIVLPVMDALADAHARGILHRDLKPDNLFLVKGQRGRRVPKLLDFGIAKLMESQTMATGTGSVLGTPHYMAPEQARGDKDLDARADVWSMGVVCFQALCGRLPFLADTPTTVLVKIMTDTAPRLRDVAPNVYPDVAAVIDRSLAADRNARFGSMAEMMTALVDAARASGLELDARLLEYRDREAPAAPAARPSSASAIGSLPTVDIVSPKEPEPAPHVATAVTVAAPKPAPVAVASSTPMAVTTSAPPPAPMPATAGSTLVPATTISPKSGSKTVVLVVLAIVVLGIVGAFGAVLLHLATKTDTGIVEIENQLDEPIAKLYLRRTGRSDWGSERLGGQPVPPFRKVTLQNVRCESYDVRLVALDGTECLMTDTSICSGLPFQVVDHALECPERRGAPSTPAP